MAEKASKHSGRDDHLKPDEGEHSNTNGPMHVGTAAVDIQVGANCETCTVLIRLSKWVCATDGFSIVTPDCREHFPTCCDEEGRQDVYYSMQLEWDGAPVFCILEQNR